VRGVVGGGGGRYSLLRPQAMRVSIEVLDKSGGGVAGMLKGTITYRCVAPTGCEIGDKCGQRSHPFFWSEGVFALDKNKKVNERLLVTRGRCYIVSFHTIYMPLEA
jgi:hypothetical protein